MATKINVGSLLNSVQAGIDDDSDACRSRLVQFFNRGVRLLCVKRAWRCLERISEAIQITDAIAPCPADCQEVLAVTATDGSFFFDRSDMVDPTTAGNIRLAGGDSPKAISLLSGGVEFLPSASGQVKMNYLVETPVYSDNEETLFPMAFFGLLERFVVDSYYEHQSDPRMGLSLQLSSEDLRDLIRWDSRQIGGVPNTPYRRTKA